MAWGEKRDLLVAENASMKREIDLLREIITDLKQERTELKGQLHHTQEALIAKESPEAYRDKKYAEDQAEMMASAPTEEQKEAHRRQAVRADAAADWLRNMEDNLFHDADDMIQHLTRATGVPMGQSASLHGNEES
jgi:hypothetical protein